MFDSHAHVAAEQFNVDRGDVIRRTREAGVSGWIEIGTSLKESAAALRLAEKEKIWASAGVHPEEVAGLKEEDWAELEKMTLARRVVAIGEVGLDYFRGGTLEVQGPALRRFLRLAQQVKKPVIFHIRSGERNAHEDLIALLKAMPEEERPAGVLHMFSGTWEQAEAYLALGYYISLSGVVTFKNAGAAPEVARRVPLERLLIETDSPYVAPEPHRGERNEPANVRFVAAKIAELRGVSIEEVERATKKNAQSLFLL